MARASAAAVEIFEILNEIFSNNLRYCALCLRTEKERKLVEPNSFMRCLCVLKIKMQVSSVCFVCEAAAARAMELLQLVSFSALVNRWFRDMQLWVRVKQDLPRQLEWWVENQCKTQGAPGGLEEPALRPHWSRARAHLALACTATMVDADIPPVGYAAGRPGSPSTDFANSSPILESVVILDEDSAPSPPPPPPPAHRPPLIVSGNNGNAFGILHPVVASAGGALLVPSMPACVVGHLLIPAPQPPQQPPQQPQPRPPRPQQETIRLEMVNEGELIPCSHSGDGVPDPSCLPEGGRGLPDPQHDQPEARYVTEDQSDHTESREDHRKTRFDHRKKRFDHRKDRFENRKDRFNQTNTRYDRREARVDHTKDRTDRREARSNHRKDRFDHRKWRSDRSDSRSDHRESRYDSPEAQYPPLQLYDSPTERLSSPEVQERCESPGERSDPPGARYDPPATRSDPPEARCYPPGRSRQPVSTRSRIDWEDKIPMDVISLMDATDPHAPAALAARANVIDLC